MYFFRKNYRNFSFITVKLQNNLNILDSQGPGCGKLPIKGGCYLSMMGVVNSKNLTRCGNQPMSIGYDRY